MRGADGREGSGGEQREQRATGAEVAPWRVSETHLHDRLGPDECDVTHDDRYDVTNDTHLARSLQPESLSDEEGPRHGGGVRDR